MYLFCSKCKPIFTLCSIFAIFQKKRPYHFEVRAENHFEILTNGLIVAMDTFHSFMALLRMEA